MWINFILIVMEACKAAMQSDSIDEVENLCCRRLKDLEEFTGLYNDNEIEDARTSEQIKSDIRKRRQSEKS